MKALIKYAFNNLLAVFCLISLLGTACTTTVEESEDRLLAKVGNKTLYLSEMEGMFPEGTTAEDSVLVLESFVGRWVREIVILNEAEENAPKDLNINKLVRDYRASLLRANYEKVLVEGLLDSIIEQSELETFYNENKLLYELQKPIVRCQFIKVPMPTPEGESLRTLWNTEKTPENAQQLKEYCDKYAEVALLEDSLWYNVEEIAAQLPEGTLTVGNVWAKREFTQRDDHHQYFFRLFEMRNRKEIAPLSYIEKQARKVILHKRKIQLIEQAKEDMYQQELRNNNIEIFIE